MPTIQQPASLAVTPTPKPFLRRPNLVRKRASLDEEAPPSSPGKRAKVTFDSDVEVRVFEDWGKAPELVYEEVRQAFARRAIGDNSGYEKLKNVYNPRNEGEDEVNSTVVRSYTTALLGNVSILDKSTSDLVHAVLGSDWLGREESYVTLYIRFLANLVSAHGVFLGETLRMIVENLTATPPLNGTPSSSSAVPRSTIYTRAHKALQYLLQLIPSATRTLCSILIGAFPHQADSRRSHIIYIQNLLKIVVYAPELQGEMLALITERLVKIDVQVQVDLEDLAEDVGEGLVQDLPRLQRDPLEDMEDSESSDDESDSDDDEGDAELERTKDITRNVEKMDAVLDILFSYYDRNFSGPSSGNRLGALDILLSQFITIILPTQKSRHTQFLLFHVSQLSPEHIDTFVGTTVQIAFDRGQPAIIRQAAAAYLASFVARGFHVPSDIVRDVFDYLGSELQRLRRAHESTCQGPDLRRYCSFYSLVQALLYIFCFRWRDLESNSEDDFEEDDLASAYGQEHSWRPGVKETLSLNLFSKLNPLKVCSPVIVTEFARIANHLGVVYVFHILETNKRIRLSQFSGAGYGHLSRETALSTKQDESHQHLDSYFPFDPYHLPRSKRWIEGDYREWAGIPGLDDELATESESEDEAAGNEVEEGTETDETLGFV